MSDYGLYQAMVQRLNSILPQVLIGGPSLDQESPPFIMIQQTPLERAPLPHHTACRTVIVQIISRYRGNAEILDMTQKISPCLEKERFVLGEETIALLKLEQTSCELEKDQITHRAQLVFSALLRFKS